MTGWSNFVSQCETEKANFELHVNARFNERVLADCLRDVAADKKLRAARVERINDERVLVCCDCVVRINKQNYRALAKIPDCGDPAEQSTLDKWLRVNRVGGGSQPCSFDTGE